MKKGIGILILLVLGYNSIYLEKLNTRQQRDVGVLDFSTRVDSILLQGVLNNPLLTEEQQLIKQLNNNLINAQKQLGNRLGIGESAYYLVKGKARITSIQEGFVQLDNGSGLDTQFIFGNEVRDASRMVNLEDFKSQKDLNALTEALNKRLRETKIPKEMQGIHVGDEITYVGACEVAPRDLPLKSLTIYPVEIKH
mgnify:FL=1|jgi:hypothetical protein